MSRLNKQNIKLLVSNIHSKYVHYLWLIERLKKPGISWKFHNSFLFLKHIYFDFILRIKLFLFFLLFIYLYKLQKFFRFSKWEISNFVAKSNVSKPKIKIVHFLKKTASFVIDFFFYLKQYLFIIYSNALTWWLIQM